MAVKENWKPFGFISREDETEKLYDLERERGRAIRACADELSKLFKVPEKDYWTHSVTESLFGMLDSIEKKSSIEAAKAFLEREGFKVTGP